jgi:hypothetical protein
MKHINVLYGESVEFLRVKADDTLGYQYALKD